MNFKDFVDGIRGTIELAIPVLAGLALLSYVWGLAKFVGKAGDAKAHGEGKSLMIWGTIALFVMVSVWGILRFLHREVDFAGSLGLPTFEPK